MRGNYPLLSRGLLAVSITFALVSTPLSTAHAVSDEVAVQLLERMGELEREISNLRGENEMLRRELSDIRTAQRESFLEVDERFSGLEKKRLPLATAAQSNVQGTITGDAINNTNMDSNTPNETITGINPVLPTESTVVASAVPQTASTPTAAAATTPEVYTDTQIPAVTMATVNTGTTTPQPAADNADAQVQVAPTGSLQQGSIVAKAGSPDNADSYYYYNTQDKNKDAGKTAVAATQTSPTAPPQKPVPSVHKAKAAYNEAYKLLVNEPKSAVPAFRAFMADYPEHNLVANAQYWLGEALYAQKDYSGATEEFMTVLKDHKGSPKAPGAALKLGYSFYELRQWDFARRTLEDTVRFFPDTNAAKLAANRLARMTAEGR